jgi:hypothetical protein
MTTTVNIQYRADEDRFRAEFVRNNKVVDWKYLTNDEHEALDLYYGLPKCESLVKLNPIALHEYLGTELDMEVDSNFALMLYDLIGLKR